ncbi:solute carrier family 2, facilitated glucose transporter member 3 [Drosophila eugracilis]|uniref:solute carrier family 2, facilitated glucose transporter member 3 n=1 Tax=Drosophila eugracilis TaxID=29029 RepID=UPI0007E889A8|nr:solute carrier family 2, facilitated glucose transporter member 3 [Drosophila eugracilis]
MRNDKFGQPEPPPVGFPSAPQQHGYLPQQGLPQPGYPPSGFSQPGFSWNPPPPQPGFSGYPSPPPPPHHGYPPQFYGAPPGYGAPQAPAPPYLPQQTTTVAVNGGWYSRNQKNKPQSNAVGAAGLIFVSGGMNIAWSIGFHGRLFYKTTNHNFAAWFIGGIIGAVLSCFLTNKIAKKYVLIFSSILVMIGGCVIASTRNNGDATLAGSYLDGIANGLVFAPFMALAGEVSVPYMRGLISASIEQMCFGLGIFLQIIYTTSWNYSTYPSYNSFSSENMKGVLSIIYGLLALIIGSLLCIESPVIMLANNNNEQGAIDALRRLQRPYTLTNETFEQLAEHKKYLAHNKELSMGQSIGQALPTFIRLLFLRGLNAMSISKFVYISFLYTFTHQYGRGSWGWFIGFGICRWMGNFVATFCMESSGRKKPTLLGLFVCSILAFVVAVNYNTGNTVMLLFFELLAGIAFTATSPYLSEAYPLGVKQHFIAFTFIGEMLVFILLTIFTWNKNAGATYFYVMGGLYLFGFFFVILCLPETRRTTLREAQEKFSKFINTGF